MIKLVRRGDYRLIETKLYTKVLFLDDKAYAWVYPKNIGEILVTSHREHRADTTLSAGQYRIYQVEDEPNLTDLQHLELQYGQNLWQGYLLLTGLPDDTRTRTRIVPTNQIITGDPLFQPQPSVADFLARTNGAVRQTHEVGGMI